MAHSQAGIKWILQAKGRPIDHAPMMGHNTKLIGWCWAEETHSWIEPTALCVLALKAMGHGTHARTREGVELLVDRQLPSGGCNYGNTTVMGQTLIPHVQPTGLAMCALMNEPADPRIEKSLSYLANQIALDTPLTSLCFALLGLTAHGRWTSELSELLRSAYLKNRRRDISSYQMSLLLLASLGPECPLLTSQYKVTI